ncbi:hypothetical protein ABH906_003843 [Pseudomonas frederiksbergensis]
MVSVEFVCGGLPLAIAHWEAVRAYMEYEVHDLKSMQDQLQGCPLSQPARLNPSYPFSRRWLRSSPA